VVTVFRVILYSQWKWSRLVVAFGSIAAIALPALSILVSGTQDPDPLRTASVLTAMRSWSVLYPVLAAALGLLMAVAAWAPDHRGGHVHALSLPVQRWLYVLMRFAAGLTLLAGPVAALLLGALIATGTAAVPPGLQAYPVALALRFALAVVVAFALFFAVSAGTTRTAGAILGVVATLVTLQVLASAAGVNLDVLGRLQVMVLEWPGPLAVFAGRWMLIDV
jgi:hypothetical protein